ncbi:thioredoxin domain-containing protein [Myxococcota bacterium]|nr:thioredoxin domain-containing protein [Myxococcota bacterium]
MASKKKSGSPPVRPVHRGPGAAATPPAASGGGAPGGEAPRAWAAHALFAVLAAGIAVAIHLVRFHYSVHGLIEGFVAGCGDDPGWNCAEVQASDYGAIFGIPTALPAIPTYLVLMGLAWRGLKGKGPWPRRGPAYAFALSAATVAYSAVLAAITVFVIGEKCIWCVALYGVNLASLVLSWQLSGRTPGALVGEVLGDLRRSPMVPLRVAGALAGLLLVAVAVEQRVHATLEEGRVAAVAGGGAVPGATPASSATLVPGSADGAPDILADDPYRGAKDAVVRVVEFADFECGYCKRMSYVLKDLEERYADRVQFVWKDYPMNPACNPGVKNNRHRDACDAAVAGRCAYVVGGNDGFWKWHDVTFKNQHKLASSDLAHYAELAGLDTRRFDSCLSDPAAMERVRMNAQQGADRKLDGTPRIFVGDRLFKGIQSPQVLMAAIEQELGASAADAQRKAREAKADGAADAAAGSPASAPEMREIRYGDLHFFIDSFEAATPASAQGKALSQADQVPALRSSWYDAKRSCEAAGKRTCSEMEWVAACQGAAPVDDDKNGIFGDDYLEGTEFPYGDFYEPGACADQGDQERTRPLLTGSMPRCVSRDGVYDLAGNAQEWVGSTEDEAALMGGAWYFKEKARCYQRHDKFGPGYTSAASGFRCCKDAR